MKIAELKPLLLSDWERYTRLGEYGVCRGVGYKQMIINALFCKNHSAAFLFWWRIASAFRRRTLLGFVAHFITNRIGRKYGIQIPIGTKIGRAFYIGHGIGIVINGNTIIGDYCSISQFLTIGSNKETPARIGNNVYIGPNVCLVENIVIGDNAKIGAGAVVVKDVPANATAVGNPARIIIKQKRQ